MDDLAPDNRFLIVYQEERGESVRSTDYRNNWTEKLKHLVPTE